MRTKTFKSRRIAGQISIENEKGERVDYDIRLLDVVSWEEFSGLLAEATDLSKLDSDDAANQKTMLRAALNQLKFLVPALPEESLRGISLTDLKDMVQFAAECASGQAEAPDEKKSGSDGPSTPSDSPAGG